MKNKFKNTLTSLLLIAALCISGISYQADTAKAADSSYTTLLDTAVYSATGNVPVSHTFTAKNSNDVYIAIYVPTSPVALSYTLTSESTKQSLTKTIASTDSTYWTYANDGTPFAYIIISGISAGNYTLNVTFATDTQYMIKVLQNSIVTSAGATPTPVPTPTAAPSLTSNSITITKGFSQTISVYNSTGTVTWSSSNSAVATVKNGKITGKKAGSATISAKTASGYVMNCKVKVKNNVYSVKKLAVKDVTAGKTGLDIYKVSYNKKGNLVIKARVLNHNVYKLSKIKNLKIKIKNNNGKVIGSYTAKTLKKVNLKAGKAKSYTFTIKKSKLKIKTTQDLRLLTNPTVSGKAWYIR